MKHVLFDTNIILDIALQRAPFFATACQLFDKIEEGEIKGFVTTSTVTDIYYIARKSLGKRESIAFIHELVEIVELLNVTKESIIDALNTEFEDFEDAVQSCVAGINFIDIIVTRNISDFIHSAVEVCTPTQLIEKFK